MAPSRRNINGRSPLVNQQRQITSFFTKTPSSPLSTKSGNHEQLNPNPISNPIPPTPSPTIPKPNHRKPLLVIGASPSPSPSPPSSSLPTHDVVGKRIKVYWPLDKAWYEGTVKSFDHATSKHLVKYDDDEEEALDLAKEKVEWPHQESSTSGTKLKRLRRGIVPPVRKMVIDDDEVQDDTKDDDADGGDGDDDDSGDEDWGKNASVDDAEEDQELELEEEDEDDDDDVAKKFKKKPSGKVDPRKRKLDGTEKAEPAKKSKNIAKSGSGMGDLKLSVTEPRSNSESM